MELSTQCRARMSDKLLAIRLKRHAVLVGKFVCRIFQNVAVYLI